MTIDWQTIAALSVVIVAFGYLLWRGWQTMTQRRSCGGCDSQKKNGPQAFVSSDTLEQPNSVTEKETHR
ncbi:MAG: hypothetical protein QF408_11940 [Pirellulales bacterium]|jgi:threonine/homoserine/homoserine lactone efflux protein|nr:hypothetical protein [Pirellulales bacterium]HJN64838.1 hypothetical protein [Pirellulales bacterium]